MVVAMKTIFVVSRGSYSDYRVEFACTSEQAARDAAAKLNALVDGIDVYEVEAFPLIDGPDEVGATVHYMAMTAEGGGIREWTYTEYGVASIVEDVTLVLGGNALRSTAATPERARKILADKIAQQRAEAELDPQP